MSLVARRRGSSIRFVSVALFLFTTGPELSSCSGIGQSPNPPIFATAIVISGGDAQTGTVGTLLGVLPSVKAIDANGNGASGTLVTFAVVSGGGSISEPNQSLQREIGDPAVVVTGSNGVASLGGWTLGTTAGANSLTATALGLSGSPLTFRATATAGSPAKLTKGGDNQVAPAGSRLSVNPTVTVTDSYGNGVSGVQVTFAVTSGGGSVTGATQTTDSNGVATVGGWTLGTTAGANTLTATVMGLSPATFTATGQ